MPAATLWVPPGAAAAALRLGACHLRSRAAAAAAAPAAGLWPQAGPARILQLVAALLPGVADLSLLAAVQHPAGAPQQLLAP